MREDLNEQLWDPPISFEVSKTIDGDEMVLLQLRPREKQQPVKNSYFFIT